MEWGMGFLDELDRSSMKDLMMWLDGNERGQSWDLLVSFYRWNLMEIIPMIASMPSVGEVLNAPKIQIVALLCILPKIFMWYERGALL